MCAPKAAPAESMATIIIGRMTDSTPVASAGAAPLNHLGVIRIRGADAANFIHNQLTQDFLLLQPQHARLAAFCTAKGRMLASFIGFKRGPHEILLLCDRSLLAATLKRLSMFVLRAKCKLSDATADFSLHGLAGDAAVQALGRRVRPSLVDLFVALTRKPELDRQHF